MSTFKLSEAFKVATDAERNNPLRSVERVICETAPGPSLAFAEAASKAAMLDAQLAAMCGMTDTISKAVLGPSRGVVDAMIDAQFAPPRPFQDR